MKRDFWWSLIVGGFLGLVFSYGLVSILRPMRLVEAAEEKNLQNDDKPYIRMPLILYKEEGFVLLFSIPSDWLGGIKEEKIDNGQFAHFLSRKYALNASTANVNEELLEVVSEKYAELEREGATIVEPIFERTIQEQPYKCFSYISTVDYIDIDNVPQKGARVFSTVATTVKNGRFFSFVGSVIASDGESQEAFERYQTEAREVLERVFFVEATMLEKRAVEPETAMST